MEVGRVKRIHVEVMTPAAALRRFGEVWRMAAADGKIEPTIGVGSIEELGSLLSPKRMELLRHVAEHPGLSVRALAIALGRDYKNVHADVADLEEQHLLERDDDGKLTAPYDEIVIRASLRRAPRPRRDRVAG
jgi:predicted transcriptional regulator